MQQLDYRAIATFCAFGFFLDTDTYYLNRKFSFNNGSESGAWLDAFAKFDWHYDPHSMDLEEATDRFGALLESVTDAQTGNRKVILPLSGGLDSRTQAVALTRLGKSISAYSYRFKGGHDETRYAKRIADACGFPLECWEVPGGYLWNAIYKLAALNRCETDFTHPRQLAFSGSYASLGDVFCLGHWGDVLFSSPGADARLDFEGQVQFILSKFTRKGGAQLAEDLWQQWGLEGTWSAYIRERIRTLLSGIRIETNANARIRAFKSRYWATRWTAANFPVFEADRPITAPYFSTEFCEFICGIPEQLLANRQIQIAYLKKFMPPVAAIAWQARKPFNLYHYKWDRAPWNIPYRILSAGVRAMQGVAGHRLIQRNWELQFSGAENDRQLRNFIFRKSTWIPETVVEKYYRKFSENNGPAFSHPVGMLLTLSVFDSLASNEKI